jgi:choline monooxygenase
MPREVPDFCNGTLALQPIERADTIPASWYTSDAMHDFDGDVLFAPSWQYVGHVSQLANPGDYLVAVVVNNPILVVRGHDGVLRAFHNVCRHRAGPLVTENGCSARMLQCKYHGWTYTLEGMLRGVPHWDRVDLFDKKDFGLKPVHLDQWEGLLFVSLAEPKPLEPVEAQFEGIRARIAPVNLATLTFHRRVVYPIACNWKVYIDNYLEGYHVPIVHPELNKVLDYSRYVTELHPRYSLHYSPFRTDADNSMYGASTTEAYYGYFFPNLMLNIVGDRLQINQVIPVDAGRCEVIFDYLYRDLSSSAALAQIAADIAYSEMVQREDEEICAHVQRGLCSRSYKTGRFSVEREEGVHHFQSQLRQAYRAAHGGTENGQSAPQV